MQDQRTEKPVDNSTSQAASRRELLKKVGKAGYIAPMTLMLLTGKANALS